METFFVRGKPYQKQVPLFVLPEAGGSPSTPFGIQATATA